MNGRYWIFPLSLAILHLGGCNTAPTAGADSWSSRGAKGAFVTEREQLARSYESRGSLRPALQEWQIISAVIETSQPRAEIARLEKAIAVRVERHRQAAKSALAKRSYADAKLSLLKVLALQPDDAVAVRELKALEGRRAYARLAAAPKVSGKLAEAYPAPTTSSDAAAGGGDAGGSPEPESAGQAKKAPVVGRPVGKANLRLALQHLSNHEYEAALERFIVARRLDEASVGALDKYIADTRSVLAERHYDNGVNAFRAARYDQAAAEFTKALEYEPGHQKARLYLTSARELEVRLGR